MQASAVVTDFMKLLEAREVDAACDLLAHDVAYINVSLPAVHGRERARRVLNAAFGRKWVGLEVHFHKIAVDGGPEEGTVLTERTDVITVGPVRIQIWVWGHFDVAGGQITLWKDYFDWWNTTVAVVRGLVGAVVPSLRPKPPGLLA